MFRSIARLGVSHPRIMITVTLLVTLFFGYQLQYLELETDLESLFISENASQEYDNLTLIVQAEDPYDAEKLAVLYDVITELEQMDAFRTPISPFTFTTFEKTGTRVRPVMPAPSGRAPETEEEIARFRKLLLSDPFAHKRVVSEDGTVFSIFFPQTRQIDEADEYYERIQQILEPLHTYFSVHVIGSIPVTVQTTHHLTHDLTLLLSLAFLFMIIFFFLGFKSARAVLLPVLIVFAGIIWSLGTMAMINYPLSLLTVSLPPIILALGSSYTIHMLNQYVRDAVGLSPEEHKEQHPFWMLDGIEKIDRTIFLAGITTLVGFLSLLFSQIDEIRQFGIGAIAGIVSSILLSLFFLPAALSLFPRPRSVTGELVLSGRLSCMMRRIGPHVIRRHRFYIILTVVLFIGTLISYPRIEQKTDYLQYYPKQDPVIQDTKFLIENVGSTQEVLLRFSAPDDAPDDGKGFFLQTDILKKLYELEKAVQELDSVSYTASFPGYIGFINEMMTGNTGVPDTRGLVILVQRIFKLADQGGYELIGNFLSEDADELVVTFNVFDPRTKLFLYDEDLRHVIDDVGRLAEEHIGDNADFAFEGWSLEFTKLTDILKKDQRNSTLLAIGGVLLISLISFLSLDFGLLTLIPLGFGLFVTYISMAVFRIPMDMASAMMSSIAIGVGVDDAIHFLLHYRRARKQLSVHDSLLDTMMITGRPIVLTTLGIVGGMLILAAASFKPIVSFGLLISLALSGACFGTIAVLPAWIYGLSRIHKKRTVE